MDSLLLSDLPIHNDLHLLTVNSYQAFYSFSERDEASEAKWESKGSLDALFRIFPIV